MISDNYKNTGHRFSPVRRLFTRPSCLNLRVFFQHFSLSPRLRVEATFPPWSGLFDSPQWVYCQKIIKNSIKRQRKDKRNPSPLRGISANLTGCRLFFYSSFRRKPESRVKRGKAVNKQPAVYILASQRNGTLYIGVTSDLAKRIWEHRNNMVEGFTNRYSVHHLVWYELHESMESAI